jgi:hypothetical protein
MALALPLAIDPAGSPRLANGLGRNGLIGWAVIWVWFGWVGMSFISY